MSIILRSEPFVISSSYTHADMLHQGLTELLEWGMEEFCSCINTKYNYSSHHISLSRTFIALVHQLQELKAQDWCVTKYTDHNKVATYNSSVKFSQAGLPHSSSNSITYIPLSRKACLKTMNGYLIGSLRSSLWRPWTLSATLSVRVTSTHPHNLYL